MTAIRPSWDETRMVMAQAIAQRSLCTRQKVGAIVTDPKGGFVGEGYNGPPAGYQHGNQPCNIWCKRSSTLAPTPDYTDCYTIHAETNALLTSDYSRRIGGSIYVTSHVCWGCAKMIANSGVARVVVEASRPDLHRDPMASYAFLQECGLEVLLNDAVMMTKLASIRQQREVQGWIAPGTPVEDAQVIIYLNRVDRRTRSPQPRLGQLSYLADEDVHEVFNGEEWATWRRMQPYHPKGLVD